MHQPADATSRLDRRFDERRRNNAFAWRLGGRDSRHPPPVKHYEAGTQMKDAPQRRVLCPIEFDVNSLAALDLARDLVREANGALYVLHVVSPPSPLAISASLLF